MPAGVGQLGIYTAGHLQDTGTAMATASAARRCACLLALLAAVLPARGGEPRADPPVPVPPPASEEASGAGLPELSVEAQRGALKHQVSSFVRALTRNPGHSDASLVRWNVAICPFVAGLARQEAELFSARLFAMIGAAGAPLGGHGCRPNLAIVVTSDPAGVLRAWQSRDAGLFGHAGMLEVRHFLSQAQARPVSTWYNIDSGPAPGRTRLAHTMSTQQSVQVSAQAEASHLALNAVLSISSAFEIIDAAQAAHVSLDQLADYAAMTVLTNIDPHVDIGNVSSILELFVPTREAPPAGLSPWDAAFLKALYQSDQSSRGQRSQIADRVYREISH